MSRTKLPDRRRSITASFRWPDAAGQKIHLTAGFDEHGIVREAFIRVGGRVGSDRDAVLDDAAVLISLLLQHGMSPSEIGASLARTHNGARTSPIGAAVDHLAAIGRGGV